MRNSTSGAPSRTLILLALAAFVAPMAFSGTSQSAPVDVRAKPPEPQAPIREALRQPVTMDFQNADFDWVMNTLFVLTGVNMTYDFGDPDEARPITIHAEKLPLQEFLDAVCRQRNLEWEVSENAVHIRMPKEERERLAREALAREKLAGQRWNASRLRVRFSDGTEIQAEGPILEREPALQTEILERALDPARNGLLAYPMREDDPLRPKVIDALDEITPEVTVVYRPDVRFLVLRADDAQDLRRAAALLRALGLTRRALPEPGR